MTSPTEQAPNAKNLLREVIEAQPDDASYDEIMREMAMTRMIERGLADVRAGRTVSHEEAVRRIRAWRN